MEVNYPRLNERAPNFECKTTHGMKTLFIISMLAASCSFAQTKEKTAPQTIDTHHIEMHEKMAKAHQEAADCLKSGKTMDECRKAFQNMCKDADDSKGCGMGSHMKDHKGKHMKGSMGDDK